MERKETTRFLSELLVQRKLAGKYYASEVTPVSYTHLDVYKRQGVRRAESRSRSKRGIFEDFNNNKAKKIVLNNDNDDKRRWYERCEKQAKTLVNPIVDWQDEDVKNYVQSEKIELNPLYCERCV